MKLNKIRALCKERQVCYLFDDFDEDGSLKRQWLSDGIGMWPVSGLPTLEESNLGTLLGVEGKKLENWILAEKEVPKISGGLGDLESWETQVKEGSFGLTIDGREFWPIDGGARTHWYDKARLAPCWSEQTILTLRPAEESTTVLAVFDGLLLAGVIWPMTMKENLEREIRRAVGV